MIRFKLLITSVFITLIVGAVGYGTHQSAARQALEADADASLRRAAAVAQLEVRTIEHAMAQKASFIAQQPDLIQSITTDYTAEQDPVFARSEKVQIRLNRWALEFANYNKAEGKGKAQSDLPLRYRRPEQPDLYFAVDSKGIGIAASGKDLSYWRGDDVSKRYPIIAEAMTKNDTRTAIVRFSYDTKVEGSLYLLAIAPIRPSVSDVPIGAVIVGYQLNDGLAKRVQSLAAGIPDGAEGEPGAAALLAAAPHIGIFFEKALVGSTLDTNRRVAVAQELLTAQDIIAKEGAEKAARVEIDKEPFFARARLLSGHAEDKSPIGVIALTSIEQATAPINAPGSTTLLVTILLAILGAGVLYVFLYLYLKEFEKLEQTIQEIIAGNKDATFSAGSGNELAVGLAQQLNLMSAFLQGKPMPDDEDGPSAGGTWGGEMGGGHKAVQGVNLAALSGKKPSDGEPPKEG